MCFLTAYLSPLQGEEPFAGIARRWRRRPSTLRTSPSVPLGPRTSHDPARGAQTLDAYRRGSPGRGLAGAAFTRRAGWTPAAALRAPLRALALPGFGRVARYELLVTLGRLGLYELRGRLAAPRPGARAGVARATRRRWPPSACSAIGDPIHLERRAAALAEALSVPIEALDLAFANWGRAASASRSAFRTRRRSATLARALGVERRDSRALHSGAADARGESAVHTGAYSPRCQVSSSAPGAAMPLCFIEPQDAIRVIAESVGREARRQLVGEVVRAWVDDIPDQELSVHYAKAIADLDQDDLHLLAAWHASLEVGQPIPNTDFLVGVFPSLGENRREALKIAAGFRGEEAFQAGVSEEQALDTVLPASRASARSSSPTSASSCTSGTARLRN